MENKEKIIGELYTIKAGLSVISQEADKIKNLQSKINIGKEDIENRELILENGDSGLPYFKNQRKSAIMGIVSFSIGVFIKLAIFFGGFIGGAVCAKTGFEELTSIVDGNDINSTKMLICFVLAFLLPLIGMGAVLLRKIPPYFRDFKYSLKELKEANKYIKDCEERTENIKTDNDKDKIAVRFFEHELEKQLSYSIPLVTATYNFLVSSCQNYIKECDFENVDLIIHFIYTGRALDIRDALLQTDALIRHNEVISVFRNEAESIRRSIDSGFNLMSAAISVGFDNLSTQLKKQHAEEISKLDSIGAGISSVKSGLDEMSSLQSIQNAYSAKIEKNSRQLAKDTAEILKYARK